MQIRTVLDHLKVPALEIVTNLSGGSLEDPTYASVFIQTDLEHVWMGGLPLGHPSRTMSDNLLNLSDKTRTLQAI